MGKGENAGFQLFSFSHNVFYPSKNNFNSSVSFILSSANAFNLDQFRILSFGKELNSIMSTITQIFKTSRAPQRTILMNSFKFLK